MRARTDSLVAIRHCPALNRPWHFLLVVLVFADLLSLH